LFLSFSSSYYRLIRLPSATYGVIGAVLGLLGFAVPPLARRMVTRGRAPANFAVVALIILVGLAGVALRWPVWGVLFVVPLGIAMSAVGYLVSYYLNAAVESHQRATVLSFKGVAFNLGYGMVSLLFAGALRALHTQSPEETFGRTLPWLPLWLVLTLVVVALGFWGKRQALDGIRKPVAA
jgi:hypothetical protein